MDHFCFLVAEILDGESDRTFDTVEVVVEPRPFKDEERSSDTSEPQFS